MGTVNTASIGHNSLTSKYSPDQNFIAVGYQGGTSILIFTSTLTLYTTITSAFNNVFEVDFSADSTKLMVCGNNGGGVNGFEIYGVSSTSTTWNIVNSSTGYSKPFVACRFAPDGSFATGSQDGRLRYFLPDYSWSWSVQPYSIATSVNTLDFTSNGSILIAGGASGGGNINVYVYSIPSGTAINGYINPNNNQNSDVLAIDFDDDGSVYAFGDKNNDVAFYNGTQLTGNISVFSISMAKVVTSVAFSRDGCWFAATCADAWVYLYSSCPKVPQPSNPKPICPMEQYMTSAPICRKCNADMVGCRMCNNATVCLVCTDQYYLNTANSLCLPCINAIKACTACSSNTFCYQCL